MTMEKLTAFHDRWMKMFTTKDPQLVMKMFSESKEGFRFLSPVVRKPYTNKMEIMMILSNVTKIFQDFKYVGEPYYDVKGMRVALYFEARIQKAEGQPGEKVEVMGVDFFQLDADGKMKELKVMLRPLGSALAAKKQMVEAMKAAGGGMPKL